MAEDTSLQFDRAEFEQAPTPAQCAECRRTLTSSYYEVNGQTVCEACRYTIESRPTAGSSVGRFARATALYYAIRELTGYELGLIAIVVGFGVGTAVRWGSNDRGGWRYQTLAIALTYLSITANYVPSIMSELNSAPEQEASESASAAEPAASTTPVAATPAETPATTEASTTTAGSPVLAIAIVFVIALALPFLGGVENIIGLIIIGIGLYEAWKLNKRTAIAITGPHMIGRPPQAAAGV
jgi:hypothetical protein